MTHKKTPRNQGHQGGKRTTDSRNHTVTFDSFNLSALKPSRVQRQPKRTWGRARK